MEFLRLALLSVCSGGFRHAYVPIIICTFFHSCTTCDRCVYINKISLPKKKLSINIHFFFNKPLYLRGTNSYKRYFENTLIIFIDQAKY